MTVSSAQLLEACRLVNQMFHDSLESWMVRHFTTWRA